MSRGAANRDDGRTWGADAALERRRRVLAALDEYESRLLHYALRLLGDVDLARDSVQHAFLKLCEPGSPLADADGPLADVDCTAEPSGTAEPGKNRVAAWLFAVCRNRATDHLRRAGRERAFAARDGQEAGSSTLDGSSPSAERLTGRDADPAETAERGELAGVLRRLVAGLAPAQREAIDLWCEGFAYRQIAEIMNRTEGDVRVLVHRGLKAVREHPQVRELLSDEQGNTAWGNNVRGNTAQGIATEGLRHVET